MAVEREYATLFTVFPKTPQTPSEYQQLLKDAKVALLSAERMMVTQDEILFMSFVKRLAQIFDKAGQMLAEEKFTVQFRGDPSNPFRDLGEYEIVPLMGIDDEKKVH